MKNKKFGFTLAEVLITLAIIGVVAALTLPTLLANYQKKEWATKLIKTYAELNQGFKLMMAQDNTSQLSQTQAWTNLTDSCTQGYANYSKSYCQSFYKSFLSVFPGATIISNEHLNYKKMSTLNGDELPESTLPLDNDYFILLKNGVLIFRYGFYPHTPEGTTVDEHNKSAYIGFLRFDINGVKGPNTLGRDIFILDITDRGNLYAMGSLEYSKYWSPNNETLYYWKTASSAAHRCNDNPGNGYGCTGRVLETGKMDY